MLTYKDLLSCFMNFIQATTALMALVFLLALGSCKKEKDEVAEINTFSVQINGVQRELRGDDKVGALAIRSDNKLTGFLLAAKFSEFEYVTLRFDEVSTGDEAYISYTNSSGHHTAKATLSPINLKSKVIEGTFSANFSGEVYESDVILSEGKFRIKAPIR